MNSTNDGMSITDEAIAGAIAALLAQRAPTASICPSEAARRLAAPGTDWRPLMPAVRRVAAALAREGALRITQGEATIDPVQLEAGLRGPIRLRRPG